MEHKNNKVNASAAEPQTKFILANISGGGFAGERINPARLNPERKMITANPLPQIRFSNSDFIGGDKEPKPLPMVISVEINDFTVRRVLLLVSSSADILYWHTFQKLGLPPSLLKPYSGNLKDVFGSKCDIKGYVDLKTTFGEGEHVDSINIRYLVIDAKLPCNVIIGMPTLNLLGAVLSVAHLTVKYPRPDGKVGVIKADIETARQCFKEGL